MKMDVYVAVVFYQSGIEVRYDNLICHPYLNEGYWKFRLKDGDGDDGNYIHIRATEVVRVHSYKQAGE